MVKFKAQDRTLRNKIFWDKETFFFPLSNHVLSETAVYLYIQR